MRGWFEGSGFVGSRLQGSRGSRFVGFEVRNAIDQIEVNRNYQKSDLLQVIRILKNYDFFRDPQLELFRHKKRKAESGPGSALNSRRRRDG